MRFPWMLRFLRNFSLNDSVGSDPLNQSRDSYRAIGLGYSGIGVNYGPG
jgi:hypothetical protein